MARTQKVPGTGTGPRLGLGHRSLDVTEQGHAAQGPVLGIEFGLEINRAHVLEVGALGLAVDGALVQLGILAGRRVYRIYIDDWHLLVEHLHLGLNQAAAAAIQRGACRKKSRH